MRVMNLLELEAVDSAAKYALGRVAAVFDATYGSLKAVYCYIQDAVAAASCYPAYEDVTAGKWYVDTDENESGVIGQEFCCGAFLTGAITTAAGFGWILTAGLNPLAMVTDGSVAAGYGIIPSSTDGTWNGIAATQNVATTGTAYNHIGMVPAVARAADSSNSLAAGGALFDSIWAGLPVTWD